MTPYASASFIRSGVDIDTDRHEAVAEGVPDVGVEVGGRIHDVAPVAPLGGAIEEDETVLAFGEGKGFVRPRSPLEQLLASALASPGDVNVVGNVRREDIHRENEDAEKDEAAHESFHGRQNQPKVVHSLNQRCTCDGQSVVADPRRFKRTAQAFSIVAPCCRARRISNCSRVSGL